MPRISSWMGVVFLALVAAMLMGAGGGVDLPPHAGQPVLMSEHAAVMNLVRASDAAAVAVRDGNWSAAETWQDRRVPGRDGVVLIPRGRTVTVDTEVVAALRAVRVEGALQFAVERNTGLKVDTLLVAPGGTLTIGTSARPIAATARIEFTDVGPIDRVRDPHALGRGLVSHGAVSIYGRQVTPFVALASAARAGDGVFELSAEPVGWRVGDTLLLPGVEAGVDRDEQREILKIEKGRVTVRPIAYDHVPPRGDLKVHVANLSRNIVLSSQTPGPGRGGHVMFMHSGDVAVANAAFIGLGRTDKSKPIDDPRVDDSGRLVAGTGTNPRGRYALHLHRTGVGPDAKSARIEGCVVIDSPGWGYVSHSSRVDFVGNICFRATGAGFVTEAGDEVGSFRNNLAVRGKGSGEDEVAREKVQDFGHEGDGYWFQGPGVVVEGNVATGQATHGFIFFTKGLVQEGLGISRFGVANLPEQSWAAMIGHVDHKDPDKIDDPMTVPVIGVPIGGFRDNIAYGCETGFTVRFHRGTPEAAPSVLADSTAWNVSYGARVRYTTNLTLRNLKLIAGNGKHAVTGVFGTLEGEQDIRYENLTVIGFPIGIHVPEAGHHTIIGGTWDNGRSIYIPTPMQRGRRVEIAGDLKFPHSSKDQFDFYLDARFEPLIGSGQGGYRDPNVLFAHDITTIEIPGQGRRQLYYPEQADAVAPFKPWDELSPSERKRLGNGGTLPGELVGKTNDQLRGEYGLVLGGAVAPADAMPMAGSQALIGPCAVYGSELAPAEVRSRKLTNYRLMVVRQDLPGNKKGKAGDAIEGDVTLKPGWNLLTRQKDGSLSSFLVFGGEVKNGAGKQMR
jgi:hypothetical protein